MIRIQSKNEVANNTLSTFVASSLLTAPWRGEGLLFELVTENTESLTTAPWFKKAKEN
jgi:hypothetical protein